MSFCDNIEMKKVRNRRLIRIDIIYNKVKEQEKYCRRKYLELHLLKNRLKEDRVLTFLQSG